MKSDSKIMVLGSNGLAGSAVVRKLMSKKYSNIVAATRKDADLTLQTDVHRLFLKHMPEYVFMCAGRVGGIMANMRFPGSFGYDNGMMTMNVIYNCLHFSVKKMLFLGSSCIYPRNCPQPMKEEYLLTSELEPTNETYALAKIFGLKLCDAFRKQYGCNFITCMPTNLYGPGDCYDLDRCHVFPALISKIHTCKLSGLPLKVWGDGTAYREFMHADDLADACLFLMRHYDDAGTVNVGTGNDITIRELVGIMMDIIGFKGDVIYDSSKPNGTPRKLLDVSKMTDMGWKHKISLEDGIASTYADFVKKSETNL